MQYYTDKQIFYVNSNDRVSGTHSDFTYTFNIDKNIEFDRVSVLSASIPKSFYLIQDGQNTLTLNENGVNILLTMPTGNYTRSSLATVFKNLLNESSILAYNYNITYSNISTSYDKGGYIFTASNVTGNQPEFIFGEHLAEQFGFLKNTTYSFVGSYLRSPYVCNLANETTLYIHSDICQNKEGNNVLQEIYSSGDATFSYVNFINPIPMEYSRDFAGANTSNSFRFFLTNENGEIVDTNGINMNFTIMIYKKNNISDLIKGAIKYFTLINEK